MQARPLTLSPALTGSLVAAALAVNGAPRTGIARINAERDLGQVLVAINGAPFMFQGLLTPDAPPYPGGGVDPMVTEAQARYGSPDYTLTDDLGEDVANLLNAVREIVARWEGGDLAEAVNAARLLADEIDAARSAPTPPDDRKPYTVTFWADDGLGAYTRRVRAKNAAEAVYRAVSGAMPSVTATCRKAKFQAVAFPHDRPDLTETFGGGLDGLALLDGITRPAGA